MTHYMGIDSRDKVLRLCILDENQKALAFVERKEVSSPLYVGRSLACELLSSAVEAVVGYAHLEPESISGVAIALVGVDDTPSWLHAMLKQVLPCATVRPTTSDEIALVGGRGERYGVLVRAGETSSAYGVNRAGEAARVGGWGHLIGDEGSRYWLGAQALRAVGLANDRRGISTILTDMVLETYGLQHPREVSTWLLDDPQQTPRVRIVEVAALVLKAAADGDEVAQQVVNQAASHLGAHYRAVQLMLGMQAAPVVFAGSLLHTDTPLRAALMANLGLQAPPERHYDAVVGAALLAQFGSRRDVPV